MNLCEEYFKRHDIKVPFAKHVEKGNLFFRLDEAGQISWHILNISKIPNPQHPPHYVFKIMIPNHNSLSNKLMMFDTVTSVDVNWDQYEDYCVRLGKTMDHTVVSKEVDVYLTAWEIYAYCFDSELVKFANHDALHKSLSLSLPSIDRLRGCYEIISYLTRNYPSMISGWKDTMLPMIKNYCLWFLEWKNERITC